MDQLELIGLLKTCKAVESIHEWNGRYYLNLWDASKKFRGDQTTKWWVDGRGILNHERGPGTWSPRFWESVDLLNAFLAEHGIEARKVV